jgi:hypothetical protein
MTSGVSVGVVTDAAANGSTDKSSALGPALILLIGCPVLGGTSVNDPWSLIIGGADSGGSGGSGGKIAC